MTENPEEVDRAVRLHGEALEALQSIQLDRAKTLALEALTIFEGESGPVHPDVANVLNCLCEIAMQQADYRSAEACGQRSLRIMRDVRVQATGPDIDRLYVQDLSALGNSPRALGDYSGAERYLCEALVVVEESLGNDDPDVVTVLNALGILYKYSGRFDEAGALYQRAVQIAERVSLDDDSLLATLLHNIGGLAHARGDHAAGEAPARRSVELRERALGRDHPQVAADLAALAAIIQGQGRYDEAENIYKLALASFERVYGSNHYEVAVTLNNLAAVREAQGHAHEAEAHYRRALAIKEAIFGGSHPDVAMTLNNLALLLAASGRSEEAEHLYNVRCTRSRPTLMQAIQKFAPAWRTMPRCSASVDAMRPPDRWRRHTASINRPSNIPWQGTRCSSR